MNRTKTPWKATVAAYERDSSGVERRKRKEITLGPTATMTKREAKRILQPILDQANAQAFNPTQERKRTTFAEFAPVWERDYLSLSKPSTIATMKGHVRQLKSAFGPDMRTIGSADLQRFVPKLSAEDYEPKTIRNFWITIRLSWSAALAQGYVAAMPTKPKLPRVFRRKPQCFTLEEVAKILAASDEDEEALALYWTAAETGMRLGELAGLRSYAFARGPHHDFYLEVAETVWNGESGTPKTPNALRRIFISAQFRNLLNSLTSVDALCRYSVVNNRNGKLQPYSNDWGSTRRNSTLSVTSTRL